MSWINGVKRLLSFGSQQIKMSPKHVIMITGCDSGLGFALAMYCHSLNMTVISACHNIESEGAQLLRSLKDPRRMITIELDLLKQRTIENAKQTLENLIGSPVKNGFESSEDNYNFTALVNNAGVMCFGEFEWQTRQQIDMQINVNVLGTMHLTKELLPLIRLQKGRIINITSHCGLQALPALSAYAASKAALRFWNDSLRMEMLQYGVEVINFVPGSFVMNSNISARQQDHANVMFENFTKEQKEFYGEYFRRFNNYLTIISGFKAPNQMQDSELLNKFRDALTSTTPKALYIHEPWRYKIYRILFSLAPYPLVDFLADKFCAMPSFKPL